MCLGSLDCVCVCVCVCVVGRGENVLSALWVAYYTQVRCVCALVSNASEMHAYHISIVSHVAHASYTCIRILHMSVHA